MVPLKTLYENCFIMTHKAVSLWVLLPLPHPYMVPLNRHMVPLNRHMVPSKTLYGDGLITTHKAVSLWVLQPLSLHSTLVPSKTPHERRRTELKSLRLPKISSSFHRSSRIKHVFSGVPKIWNRFSNRSSESPSLQRVSEKTGKIWRCKCCKFELLCERG